MLRMQPPVIQSISQYSPTAFSYTMSSESQPPLKRGRTAANKNRGFESPSEELSHVANLVERRRVQNRISQRNYRNKIRNRLEKLEALVETNKAQKQSQSPGAPSPATPDVSRSIDASPGATRADDHAMQNEPPRTVPQTCICAFGDFDTPCSCGGMNETVQPLLDSMGPFSSFVEADGADSLYINLPSPESLQCNTPTTPFHDEILKFDNISASGSISEQASNSASQSRERLDTSLLSMDMPPNPLHQPYDRFHGSFAVPMGYHVVPMGYMATPAHPDSSIQNGAGGRPWSPTSTTYTSSIQSPVPVSSMQHYFLTPAPMMMVPMHHPMSPQQTSDSTPRSKPQ